MLKVTAKYRNHNPIKLVFPLELGYGIEAGTRIMLSDNETPDVVGHVVRSYRTPRQRRLAWVQWDV